MAVPANPSIASRALYYPATPTAGHLIGPAAQGFTETVGAGVVDIGQPGVPLPALVVSVGGSAPDYSGMILSVHLPNGASVARSAGFAPGQPMLNQATWVSQGSNPAQARWVLVDALS